MHNISICSYFQNISDHLVGTVNLLHPAWSVYFCIGPSKIAFNLWSRVSHKSAAFLDHSLKYQNSISALAMTLKLLHSVYTYWQIFAKLAFMIFDTWTMTRMAPSATKIEHWVWVIQFLVLAESSLWYITLEAREAFCHKSAAVLIHCFHSQNTTCDWLVPLKLSILGYGVASVCIIAEKNVKNYVSWAKDLSKPTKTIYCVIVPPCTPHLWNLNYHTSYIVPLRTSFCQPTTACGRWVSGSLHSGNVQLLYNVVWRAQSFSSE